MNGAEMNLLVFRFLEAVADDNDAEAQRIGSSLPEDARWNFVVNLARWAVDIIAAATGPDWREHMSEQRLQIEAVQHHTNSHTR